jgi:hypothetical protein
MRHGLLTDENSRETLIEAGHPGSAQSHDVMSPIIRPIKPDQLQAYARKFYAQVAPAPHAFSLPDYAKG